MSLFSLLHKVSLRLIFVSQVLELRSVLHGYGLESFLGGNYKLERKRIMYP